MAALRAELTALADELAGELEPGRYESTRHALDYLAAQPLLHLLPRPPLDPATAAKFTDIQADVVEDVVRAMLDSLDLPDEQYHHALEVAVEKLTEASEAGWPQ